MNDTILVCIQHNSKHKYTKYTLHWFVTTVVLLQLCVVATICIQQLYVVAATVIAKTIVTVHYSHVTIVFSSITVCTLYVYVLAVIS